MLVGTSGSGKSTTLKMINRLLEPDRGTIRFAGEDIRQQPVLTLRRRMGYAIQSIGLFPHWTVAQNIATVPQLQRWRGQDRRPDRRADGAAGAGGDAARPLPASALRRPAAAGGVARALAADPEVLLMDEPFGALDPVTREALQQEMLRIHRLLGRTIVLVTHDIDEALRLADHGADGRGRGGPAGAPLEMLLRPKNSFVQTFWPQRAGCAPAVAARGGDYLRPDERLAGEGLTVTMTLREALSQFVARRCETLPVVDAEGRPCGTLHFADLLRREMSHEGAS